MNNDLISREALREKVNAFYDSHFKGLVPTELITYAEAVDDLIDNAPTVEEPIKALARIDEKGNLKIELLRSQGEWIRKSNEANDCYWYECNQCGCIPYYARSIKTVKFCSNCGAKMREVDDDI